MGVTAYKPISWDEEPVGVDKLKAMASNDQWLFENLPRMSYNAYNVKRTTGVKVAAGLVAFPASRTNSEQKTVFFGNFFSVGARPVIVTSIVWGRSIRIAHGVNGIGERHPDHRGFVIAVAMDINASKGNYIDTGFWVSWIAVGY